MSSNESVIVLLDNFAKSEAEAALKAYHQAGGDPAFITIAPVTDKVLSMTTTDAVQAVELRQWPGGTVRAGGRRGALLATADKNVAIALMRAFKSILPADSDPAFAMITATGAQWSIQHYLNHIREEHEFMKTNHPSKDPDMRAMDE